MKNIINIDIDTERNQSILIGKPEDSPIPQNKEEASAMLKNDIACICEALCSLIHMADQNKYFNKKDLIEVSIRQLNNMLIEKDKSDTII